ncbi:hypothetical protein [Vallitalea okinawensis]|uniref:hypothetical protein n=1 Tax=Vallitalea okinawensis TaxID=2078660 RepID=UPI000CFBCC0F|nr:hypothetical protein [Vallitalea okinawensis]
MRCNINIVQAYSEVRPLEGSVFIMSFKPEHKCDNLRDCKCPVSSTPGFSGSFNLKCGECLKIFESDEPVEVEMEIGRVINSNDCSILIFVEVQNGKDLVFEIPKSDNSFTNNRIFFITKQARKVTIECKNDNLDGGVCIGVWDMKIILRGSDTDKKCECPVQSTLVGSSSFQLSSGNKQTIFESGEPTEIFMIVDLEPTNEQCTLTVIVDLDNCSCLKFVIPEPESIANDITFYSKNVVRVTIESLALTSCLGLWERAIILRGA